MHLGPASVNENDLCKLAVCSWLGKEETPMLLLVNILLCFCPPQLKCFLAVLLAALATLMYSKLEKFLL